VVEGMSLFPSVIVTRVLRLAERYSILIQVMLLYMYSGRVYL